MTNTIKTGRRVFERSKLWARRNSADARAARKSAQQIKRSIFKKLEARINEERNFPS